MDINTLTMVVAVAETGSLTKAAAATGITQSAISRQIAQLENECGGRLFQRTGRGMSLSELGSRMLPRIQRMLAEANGMLSEAQELAGVPVGEVRIGLLPNVAGVLARRLFSEVRRKFPRVRLVLYEGYTGQLEEWLDAGKIDLAVLFHYGKSVPKNQDLLASVDSCLVSLGGDSLTSGATVPFDKLNNLPLILPSSPNALRTYLEATARRRRIQLNPVAEANSIPVQLELIAGGDCYTIIPYFAVAQKVKEGALQASVISHPSIVRKLTLQLTTERPLNLACREVAREVRKNVESLRDGGAWGRLNAK